MRFAYVYSIDGKLHIQAGRCDQELVCTEPAWWSTEVMAAGYPDAGHFFPSIRSNGGGSRWLLTWVSTAGAPTGHVSVWGASISTDPETAPRAIRLGPFQSPCPARDYWGDYDEMGDSPLGNTFVRPFTLQAGEECELNAWGNREQSPPYPHKFHVGAVAVNAG